MKATESWLYWRGGGAGSLECCGETPSRRAREVASVLPAYIVITHRTYLLGQWSSRPHISEEETSSVSGQACILLPATRLCSLLDCLRNSERSMLCSQIAQKSVGALHELNQLEVSVLPKAAHSLRLPVPFRIIPSHAV